MKMRITIPVILVVGQVVEVNKMNEECAICAEDYHDSDQYICDDCHNELEALKADQLASRYD